MATLTLTARGQVTFRKDLLQHMGLEPGQQIEVNKEPDGKITLSAAPRTGKMADFIGILAGKTTKVATLEELDEAAAAGWAGEVDL